MVCLLGAGCAGLQETPVEVLEEYDHLASSLDPDRLGESIQRLRTFREQQSRYFISRKADELIAGLLDKVEGRYRLARDLARDNELERAETILRDLAQHLPDTRDGRDAAGYLRFEFPFFKAQWLMREKQADEAEVVARELAGGDLTDIQSQQVQLLLDNVSTMNHSLQKAEEARTMSAGRQLQIHLQRGFARTKRYPAELILDRVDLGRPERNESLRGDLSAIEDYRSSERGFSLMVVSPSGRYRFLVTESGVEPVKSEGKAE